MVYRILTATYTDRVETLSFDSEAKSLSITSSLTVGHHPSWITPNPENQVIWFTALEQEDGRVVAIEYDKEGKGKVIGDLSSEGSEPCTLVAYKGDILIGNVSFFFLRKIVVPIFTGALIDICVTVLQHVVYARKRRCAPHNFFTALCDVVHDESFAWRFWSRPGSAAFVSPSPGDSTSDP